MFRLVYLPGRGLIGSTIALLGLVLRVLDHTAFSRSGEAAVPPLIILQLFSDIR